MEFVQVYLVLAQELLIEEEDRYLVPVELPPVLLALLLDVHLLEGDQGQVGAAQLLQGGVTQGAEVLGPTLV